LGGIAYNALGMRFNTPFINMFERDEDYLRLLANLKYYLNQNLQFVRYSYNPGLHIDYPICRVDDVELEFNHYNSMEMVEEKWYKRVKRVNFDNLFIMMFTNNKKSLDNFDKLDYQKKICFVPFESPLKSACSMKLAEREEMSEVPFYEIVNGSVNGRYHDYDLIELLLNGRINHDRCCYNKKLLD
jgi:uncharacterized protein (DUF1919 family)